LPEFQPSYNQEGKWMRKESERFKNAYNDLLFLKKEDYHLKIVDTKLTDLFLSKKKSTLVYINKISECIWLN
jgi:hypothetical protein